jgi:membrane-bound metal-dependent hydrolase YbcI (DUF457 family)
MFIGHFAVGMAAKSQAPTTSLGTLFVAAQLLDLLWPPLLLAGWEHVEVAPGITAFSPLDFTSYPISHSLLMAIAWSVLAGAAYLLLRRDRRAAVWVGLCVGSHWVLDLVTHRPDLPLVPGDSSRVGLGLWDSVAGTLIVEGLLFAVGVWIYSRTTVAVDRRGRWGTWSLVAFLVVTYVISSFSAPPPDERAIAFAGLAMWLLVAWAYWADGHRRPATAA